jgi:ariadne-1
MICFDEDDLVGFGCKHFFCSDCWNGHLKSKIENDQFLINCPYDKCLNILSEEIVQFVITDSKLFDAYLASAANSLIQISKCVKWCPGVDCGRAIRSNTPDCYGVKCSCSTSFCIKCDLENHDPLTCARLETWQKKSAEDNASKKWLNQHSKPCPSCKVRKTYHYYRIY